jgi:hypothetical protein
MVENRSNNEKAVSSREGDLKVPRLNCEWMERRAVVAQDKAQAVSKPFHFESHGFGQARVGVADDIRAGFIDCHDDSGHLLFTESRAVEKIPHAFAHFREVGGFAWKNNSTGAFHFSTILRGKLISALGREYC